MFDLFCTFSPNSFFFAKTKHVLRLPPQPNRQSLLLPSMAWCGGLFGVNPAWWTMVRTDHRTTDAARFCEQKKERTALESGSCTRRSLLMVPKSASGGRQAGRLWLTPFQSATEDLASKESLSSTVSFTGLF